MTDGGLFGQMSLFSSATSVPEGFRHREGLITADEEWELIRGVEGCRSRSSSFRGTSGSGGVVSFGWRYDFDGRRLQKADDVPGFLLPLRERAAGFAGLGAGSLQHVLVTEYAPGAAIGWHKDKAVFDEVVGVSLGSACRFRFRRQRGEDWERFAVDLRPRSAYLLSGPARTEWEHSIPPVERLRYSVTFRNFKER